MTDTPHTNGSESENPAIDSPTPATSGRPRTIKDWWPNQLDLTPLKKHSASSTPLSGDYKDDFASLDVDCAVGDTPCLTASDGAGYEIDEAEVIYWGRCRECIATTSGTDQRKQREEQDRRA